VYKLYSEITMLVCFRFNKVGKSSVYIRYKEKSKS
jgi:hypothetical protein